MVDSISVAKIKILKPRDRFMGGRKLQVYGDVGAFAPALPPNIKSDPERAARFSVVHIPGVGMTLNLDDQDHKDLYDILHYDKTLLSHHNNVESRYKWLDTEGDAKDYLASMENEMTMVSMVTGLKGKKVEILRAARALGLTGTENIILAELYKMCKSTNTLLKVSDYFMSPIKNLLDIYYANLEKGSAQEKRGLYLNDKGTYMWNSIMVGRSMDEVIGWMKSPDNKDEYQQMKAVLDEDKK